MDEQVIYRRITSMPSDEAKLRCHIVAYVGSDMLASKERVEIRCNCESLVSYVTSDGTNVTQCGNCHKVIGILGVEGGPGFVEYTRPDGSKGSVPVHGYD